MANPSIDRLEQEMRNTISRVQADLAQKQQMISQLQGQQMTPEDTARLDGLRQLLAALDPNQPTTLADVSVPPAAPAAPGTPPATPAVQ
jgi:hypothetical protein